MYVKRLNEKFEYLKTNDNRIFLIKLITRGILKNSRLSESVLLKYL
jgi:hypothetical protein